MIQAEADKGKSAIDKYWLDSDILWSIIRFCLIELMEAVN